MTIDQALILARKIKDRQHSEEEMQALLQYLQTAPRKEAEQWMTAYYEEMQGAELEGVDGSAFAARFVQLQPVEQPIVRSMLRWKWAAAAAVLVLIGTGVYFATRQPSQEVVVKVQQNIAPGKSGAVLTLADGSQVVLDSIKNGVVALQNGSKALLKNGQLFYEGEAEGIVAYNTMSTPKGRQFQLQLPDGTQVWMNAASSIRYPTTFNGKERKVEVTGEVYFEIVKNEQMPFRVKAGNKADIEVLGTHFNVNAYDDEESLNATLLEGAIRVTKGTDKVILKPGQQARVEEHIKVIPDADIDKVMAWKNGFFNFENANLQEVMRQLQRWYDIEVVYEKGVPDMEFVGKMSKNINLADLLTILEKTNVHFRLEEGRRLIVEP